MQIEKRTLNWFPRASAWNTTEAQREKRKANHDAFLEQQSTTADAFQGTRDDLTYGLAELTAKMAAARISKKA
jgi:hypothetical protein